MDRRYRERGLRIIGLHAPEFDPEKKPENVRRQVEQLGITYPVVIDNDLKMWNALGNRYWPAFYLIDKRGKLRHLSVGETHTGSPEASEIEGFIEKLLQEPA